MYISEIHLFSSPTMKSDADSQSNMSTHSTKFSGPNFKESGHQDSGTAVPLPTFTTPITNRQYEPLPPSSGPFRSSLITGNAQERAAGHKRKAQKARSQTLKKKKEKQTQDNEVMKQAHLKEVFEYMETCDLSL
jgi:hypothetical protein